MYCFVNVHQSNLIKDYSDSYLKNKPPDCILYSEDGTAFKTHKELLGQTKFLRKLIIGVNCCGTVEIICPCSKEELGKMIEFLINGQVKFDKKWESKFKH